MSIPVLLDGLNLAHWCGIPPSLRLPLGVLAALLRRGDAVRICFDASTRHRLAAESAVYDALLGHARYAMEVRSGIDADRVLLREATRQGACIVSRDRYRDHRRRHRRLIDDPAGLLGGSVSADRVQIPGLALDLPLPPSAEAAWSALQPMLRP
jgi:hypothetical protein